MDNAFQRYGNGGPGSAMNLPVAAAPPPAAPIPAVLDEQEKALYELHSTIDGLTDRLSLVLAPPPPAAQGVGRESPPKAVQIISRVQDHTTGIQFAIGRIQDLLARVQL